MRTNAHHNNGQSAVLLHFAHHTDAERCIHGQQFQKKKSKSKRERIEINDDNLYSSFIGHANV